MPVGNVQGTAGFGDPALGYGVGDALGQQRLERDRAIAEARLPAAVDDPHPAAAEDPVDAERSERLGERWPGVRRRRGQLVAERHEAHPAEAFEVIAQVVRDLGMGRAQLVELMPAD